MNLTINGETQSHSAETLGALVEGLGMKPDRVAIELNREIVPRERWPQTPLHDGDRLEIVHFVGGGTYHPAERIMKNCHAERSGDCTKCSPCGVEGPPRSDRSRAAPAL